MTKEDSQLTDQELNQIRAEAERFYPGIFFNGNIWRDDLNCELKREAYIAAATKYQERIKGLLEGLKMLTNEDNRQHMISIADHTITNYNESLNGKV